MYIWDNMYDIQSDIESSHFAQKDMFLIFFRIQHLTFVLDASLGIIVHVRCREGSHHRDEYYVSKTDSVCDIATHYSAQV